VTGPDARGDGDGWVKCELGHRHWGLFGAAGLLVHRPTGDGGDEVLLQHRATWSHHGGTWGLLGGARHSDESAVVAALREAGEEGGLSPADVEVHGQYDDAHGGWAYATVLAMTDGSTEATPTGGESIDVGWFTTDAMTGLPLHPGFAATWPLLRDALRPLTLVVDAANVVGSRPDGWWKDRAGAARRLVAVCAALASAGVAGSDLPDAVQLPTLDHWWPRVLVVVEGAARPIADEPTEPGVEVVEAPGSGDDTIVDVARRAGPGPVLVVTADRELRRRVESLGATTVGPRWLTDLTG
jgi:8-oxo-dGTP diphosphatase